MTATLIAVQNVVVNGGVIASGAVFSIDDANAASLLSANQAATSVAQQTADAALFPLTPTDDPHVGPT